MKRLLIVLLVLSPLQVGADCFFPQPGELERGDVNCSGSVNITDLVLLSRIVYEFAPPPGCSCDTLLDFNADGAINGLDVNDLAAYLYQGCTECQGEPHCVEC